MHAQCATGAAGGIVDPAYTYFCGPDMPAGAVANGAGHLCYSSMYECHNGTNSCGEDFPCVFSEPLCATGQAASADNNWFCMKDLPTGAVPSGSGARRRRRRRASSRFC